MPELDITLFRKSIDLPEEANNKKKNYLPKIGIPNTKPHAVHGRGRAMHVSIVQNAIKSFSINSCAQFNDKEKLNHARK